MYKGSCLCGNITYSITEELGEFGFCHCKSCRKASGSAHAANIGVEEQNFHLSDPQGRLTEYQSSPGKIRAFCGRCGSPLYAYLTKSENIVRVRLGSLDTDFDTLPSAHTFVSHKAHWEPIEGTLPQFPEWAPRAVLVQKGSKQP